MDMLLQVVLQEQVELDDVGAPVASEWSLRAFGKGSATERRCQIQMSCRYPCDGIFGVAIEIPQATLKLQ